MKISIIGYSGSGKSTLTKKLGEYYKIPYLYLDTVQFKSDWIQRDYDEALEMVDEFLLNESWVIDGTYSGFRQKERFELSDKIIFMDFNRFTCLVRAYKRLLTHKNKVRESISTGCIEKIDSEFLWWLLYEGRKKSKRDKFKRIVEEYNDKVIVIKNQRELDKFLKDYS